MRPALRYTVAMLAKWLKILGVCLYVVMAWSVPVASFAAAQPMSDHACCDPASASHRDEAPHDCDPKACHCVMAHAPVFLAPILTPYAMTFALHAPNLAPTDETGASRYESPPRRPPRA